MLICLFVFSHVFDVIVYNFDTKNYSLREILIYVIHLQSTVLSLKIVVLFYIPFLKETSTISKYDHLLLVKIVTDNFQP